MDARFSFCQTMIQLFYVTGQADLRFTFYSNTE